MDNIDDLTPEQEAAMLEFWNKDPNNPPSLSDLASHVFGRECDGRSKEARAIKKALSRHNLKAKAKSEYQPIAITLDEAHKEYITNNAATMSALEIAKILFDNPVLINLSAETRAVNEFIKTLDKGLVLNSGAEVENVPTGDYEPPKTMDKVVRKVNLYLNSSLEKDKLSSQQRKGMEALINYLHTFRFIKQINTYSSESDRKSFEDAFIRYTYDKPSLSQEEIDQYIVLCNEVVISFKAQRRSERLQCMLEDITDNSPENAKIAMSLVEAIGKAQSELNLSIKRQQDLFDDLTEKRSDKLSKRIQENASVLNILDAWRNEESRLSWLKLADRETQSVVNEVEKLTEMSEIKAKLFGLSPDEIKYG